MHDDAALRKMFGARAGTRRWDAVTACVAALAMVASPLSGALAAPPAAKKRVLVVRVQRAADVPAMVATRVEGYLDTLLAMDGKIELVPAAALAPLEAPKKSSGDEAIDEAVAAGAVAAADEAAAQADKLMARRKWADAIKTWTRAVTLYEKGLGHLEDNERLVAALVGRAFAYFGAGYDDNGEEELGRALQMSPELALDAKKAPKTALAVVERVRTRATTPAGVQLRVTASAPRAVVFVDGKNRGTAPLTLGDLARGNHAVRVVAEGHEPFGQLVFLTDASVEVQATLDKKAGGEEPGGAQVAAQPETGLEPHALAGDFGEAAFQAAAKKLAKANRLDSVLFTYIRKEGRDFAIGMFVWEAAKGRLGVVEPARVSSDLGGLQVALLDLVERTGATVAEMKAEQVVTGRPAFYDGVEVAAAPPRVEEPKVEPKREPVVVAPEPKKEPVKEPRKDPKKEPKKEPVAVAPEPKKEPVVVEPVEVEPVEVEPVEVEPVEVEPVEVEPVEPKRLEPLVLEPIEAHVTRPPLAPDPIEDDDEAAFYETWWFWAIVGGLAAGSAAAIAVSQDGGSSAPGGFRATVTW